jgi:hypothetical protein
LLGRWRGFKSLFLKFILEPRLGVAGAMAFAQDRGEEGRFKGLSESRPQARELPQFATEGSSAEN